MSINFIILFLAASLPISTGQNGSVSCPLNFNVIRPLVGSNRPKLDIPFACRYARLGLQLVESDYLRRTNLFVPPPNTAESCWTAYQNLADDFFSSFDLRQNCGYQTDWIGSSGCMNITNRNQFENLIPKTSLNDVVRACNQSLSGSACSSCTLVLSSIQAVYLNGSSYGNLTDCRSFPFIYAAAFANQLGPTDRDTAVCLFSLDLDFTKSKNKHRTIIIAIASVIGAISLLAIAVGFWFYRSKKFAKIRRRRRNRRNESNTVSALDSITGSTTLVKFTIQDIKEATRNFARENIIGRGGYGNVYKGVLPDDSEVALKRFKNCSAAGDASFTHEVEVIASVRHVNLVALRGYCIATTPFEGYQRIIVTDLVKNGSLHDHLFGGYSSRGHLSWPIRRKIALGTARGLAYLHHGAQPAIIHRDIKASNILLDESFEAKVADFGLAKFAPEGATHLSTRVAGTMGYVAPEYALYGQLTERSDVYSFGVVLLELLSGKKALLEVENGKPVLLADWAWSMVRKGTPLEVIDSSMSECGPPEIMEKFVLAAVLSSHPQLYARPTMDQVLIMFDTDVPVPSIPERPIPLIAGLEDIEKSISSSGSGHLATPRGYQAYSTFEMDAQMMTNEEENEEEVENEVVEDEKARLSGSR
ncbi:probable LRR receptor-like serine/threonine-protein kinase RKF3 [Rutidosis leptorrhynchoides]|uniref:probable LRR receptor-like serine/threonine-protein kinase RKF3 n=1 Tax=Rutidosis leptorrhynchoides TaxID=125765 RepID=UPI003A99301E